jgi:formylglycine-generating enzyme required for sulfatase activity
MKRSLSICLLLVCLSFGITKGNGIVLSNITSVNGAGYVQLQFDLTWNNSWNNAINRDAAWVFFKFKDNDGTWHHLNLTNANNTISAGYNVTVPADLTGAMISRSAVGAGTVTLLGVQVGVNNLPGSFDIKGFAIEMVRIPLEASYYLGDGNGGIQTYRDGASNAAFLVNANTITMGVGAGQLADGYNNGTLATGYPIGYNSAGASLNLYMMKHEISQAAYRDFLNTLTYSQQINRTAALPNSAAGTQAIGLLLYRNGIKISTAGVSATTPAIYGCDLNNNSIYNESTDGEWVACNYISYMDVAAFLDWAALRPMTEMEYEKSCRGPNVPIKFEYAAGTTAIASYTYTISNAGATNESIVYTGAVLSTNVTSANTSPGASPLRVGIHATAGATRISAGAGYYGALDLSGNVAEVCVTSGNAAGQSFTGVNGDGELNTTGDATSNYWPGMGNNTTTTVANTVYGGTTGVTGAAGCYYRGSSSWDAVGTGFRMSSRLGTLSGVSARNGDTGGRGVKNW